MSTKKRLSHEDSRRVALEAAQTLLLESGPQAVTLKAVALRVGRTHSNLLHHFGSASGLQRSLAGHLASSVCDTIGQAVFARREGTATARELVDMIFDAFDREGAGALASWVIASGNEDALEPIFAAIRELVERIAQDGEEERIIKDMTMMMVLPAMGNAMIGEALAASLDMDRDRSRFLIADRLQEALPRGRAG